MREIDNKGRFVSKYDNEYIKKLVEEYSTNRNYKEICEREGITRRTLYYHARKLGMNPPKRKYKVNESYFDTIDTEAKAYILGFIMADGGIAKTNNNKLPNRLYINISHKDRSVLEFIVKELECDYTIKDYIPEGTYSCNKMSLLGINSQKICLALNKYGIVKNKTGKETLPELPKEMYRHFIRGFLDGDGWITNCDINIINFTSNKDMLVKLHEFLIKELKLNNYNNINYDQQDRHTWYLSYGSKEDVRKIKEYMYSDATIYLDRKYSKLTQWNQVPGAMKSLSSFITEVRKFGGQYIFTAQDMDQFGLMQRAVSATGANYVIIKGTDEDIVRGLAKDLKPDYKPEDLNNVSDWSTINVIRLNNVRNVFVTKLPKPLTE